MRTERPPAKSALLGMAVALCLLAAALWATEPERWYTGGSVSFGRSGCSAYCRLRGRVADVLKPSEAEHCLCGMAYGTWE
jgi:hypothetical protein